MVYYNKNDEYFSKHFNQLVKKYGGEWIVIAGGRKIGIGDKSQLKALVDQARKRFPKDTPLVSPIPREDEIQCIL